VYELRKTVGDVLRSIDERPGIRVLLDGGACGGNGGQIRFYGEKPPGHHTYLAAVDAALVQNGEIRVVVEIEHSDIRPLYLCGKVLATAISQYGKYGDELLPISEKLLFLQVFAKRVEDEEWSKLSQCRYLENQISQGLRKYMEGRLKCSFHFGTIEEFLSDPRHQEPLRQEILQHLGS
jgi:hypothetical protein